MTTLSSPDTACKRAFSDLSLRSGGALDWFEQGWIAGKREQAYNDRAEAHRVVRTLPLVVETLGISPGPWRVGCGNWVYNTPGSERHIITCEVGNHSVEYWSQAFANARLVAQAPALYTALSCAVQHLPPTERATALAVLQACKAPI